MKAMVLAAGFGTRLRPLTLETPKPLLQAGGRPLVEYQLDKLRDAGVKEVVVNVHHLGKKIEQTLGDGSRFGLRISYSRESELLETGGGIVKALPLLAEQGDEPFLCISGDTYSEFDFGALPDSLPDGCLGVMVMTDNPLHHSSGDFRLTEKGLLALADSEDGSAALTYTGIAMLSPGLFTGEQERAFPLRRVFDKHIAAGMIRGIHFEGYWCDVGTIERLDELRNRLEA